MAKMFTIKVETRFVEDELAEGYTKIDVYLTNRFSVMTRNDGVRVLNFWQPINQRPEDAGNERCVIVVVDGDCTSNSVVDQYPFHAVRVIIENPNGQTTEIIRTNSGKVIPKAI